MSFLLLTDIVFYLDRLSAEQQPEEKEDDMAGADVAARVFLRIEEHDRIGLLLAALGHDVGHRGFNNGFLGSK